MLWRLPAADLLYVGRSTRKTLDRYGIKTIGELALSDPEFLERLFGKMGLVLYSFANGWDDSPVSSQGYEAPMKSIGNSTTTPRDLVNNLDVQIVLMALSESVAARLRKHGFKCKVVSITIRDSGLFSFSRQKKLECPTDITNEIMAAANALFIEHYNWQHPIRSLGIRAEKLVLADIPVQLDLFISEEQREKQEKMDQAVDEIRRRFGYFSIQKAFVYQDKALASLDAQSSHKIVMDFTFSHKICGECFYKTELQVKRLSDSVDTIPVLISEQIADITKSRVGEFAEIYGEFHSHNLREENHTRLELYVFAREVKFVEVNDSKTDYTNRILLEGTICKPTVYRKTPLKKEITDLLLAVNRSFGKSDYIPCICWGSTARYAADLKVGTRVMVWGRIQSREYKKRIEENETQKRIVYEVSINTLEVA